MTRAIELMYAPIEERLFYESTTDDNGCLNFGGHLDNGGYGSLKFDGKESKAHRVAYILKHGTIPEGKMVLHKCDNPRCINVDHLFLGNQLDNMRDMTSKGRHANMAGINNGNAKLSEEAISHIFDLLDKGVFQSDIAAMYGVAQTTISYIKRRGRK